MTDLGELVRVPVKVDEQRPRADVARAQLAAITPELADLIRGADLVMAHVAMPSGWAVSQVVAPDQPMILVEHASYVPSLLAHPEAKAMLVETVQRSECVLTAGEDTARMLRAATAETGRKIWAVGNPLSTTGLGWTEPKGPGLDHWIYVGNLLAAKGVLRLAGAFGRFAKNNTAARLTVVGQGVDREAMERVLQQWQARDKVCFTGSLDRSSVGEALSGADVMIHLSLGETFGLAPLEGLVSGLPLVATRTHGGLQTLGPAVEAGRALMLPVKPANRPSEEDVVLAVASLAACLSATRDQASVVRQAIIDRYGTKHFAELVQLVMRGESPYPTPNGNAIVVMALSRPALADAVEPVRQALWDGHPVVLVVAHQSEADQQDPRVVVVDVSDQIRQSQALCLVDWVLRRPVQLALGAAARFCALMGRLRVPRGYGLARAFRSRSKRWGRRVDYALGPAVARLVLRGQAGRRLGQTTLHRINEALASIDSEAPGPPQLRTSKHDPRQVVAIVTSALGSTR